MSLADFYASKGRAVLTVELAEIFLFLVVLGLSLCLVFLGFICAYFFLMRRYFGQLRTNLDGIEAARSLANGAVTREIPTVPPMRIHLEFAADNLRAFGVLANPVAQWCQRNGFRFLGQFVIEEMADEMLRVYRHERDAVLLVLRLPNDLRRPYVEFSMLLEGEELVGVANPPATTVGLPDGAISKFYSEELNAGLSLLDRMWMDVEQILRNECCMPVPQDEVGFATLYESAHANEMDQRLRMGGVSEREIRDSLREQGHQPTVLDVERIQQQWQHAIELHLMDFSARASNCFYSGRSVLIVYEGSQHSYLATRMLQVLSSVRASSIQDQDRVVQSFTELHRLLDRFSPREAIARFRACLPKEMRYDLVDQLQIPIEADCYVLPLSSGR